MKAINVVRLLCLISFMLGLVAAQNCTASPSLRVNCDNGCKVERPLAIDCVIKSGAGTSPICGAHVNILQIEIVPQNYDRCVPYQSEKGTTNCEDSVMINSTTWEVTFGCTGNSTCLDVCQTRSPGSCSDLGVMCSARYTKDPTVPKDDKFDFLKTCGPWTFAFAAVLGVCIILCLLIIPGVLCCPFCTVALCLTGVGFLSCTLGNIPNY